MLNAVASGMLPRWTLFTRTVVCQRDYWARTLNRLDQILSICPEASRQKMYQRTKGCLRQDDLPRKALRAAGSGSTLHFGSAAQPFDEDRQKSQRRTFPAVQSCGHRRRRGRRMSGLLEAV